MARKLQGVIPPMTTPFSESGDIVLSAVTAQVRYGTKDSNVRAIRRVAVALAIMAGGLLCCTPAGAQPASGPTSPATVDRISANLVDVPMPNGKAGRAYIARPTAGGPFPAVVLLHGTNGFSVPPALLAEDFAAAGFVAIAACWFKGNHLPPGFRTPPNLPCPEGPVFDGANLKTVQNARAVVDFARGLPDVSPHRVAVWGQSRGGTAALLLAITAAPVRAVVAAAPIYAWPKRGGAYNDDFPIRYLDKITVPVLILQGTDDKIFPVAEAREFEAAARKAGIALEAEYFEGQGHEMVFVGPQREAARDRTIAFLRKTLGN
jgi:dienelactone hydrolase